MGVVRGALKTLALYIWISSTYHTDETGRCYLFVAIDRATRWVTLSVLKPIKVKKSSTSLFTSPVQGSTHEDQEATYRQRHLSLPIDLPASARNRQESTPLIVSVLP